MKTCPLCKSVVIIDEYDNDWCDCLIDEDYGFDEDGYYAS